MKLTSLYIALLLTLFIGFFAENARAESGLSATQDSTIDLRLPPLDTVINWAEKNSPILRGQDALLEKTTQDVQRIKKLWLDAFKVSTSYQAGNYGNEVVNQLQTGFAGGLSMSFSLYQMMGLKNQVQVYNAEKMVAAFKREELSMDLRKLVILLYNNVQAQKNILKIRSEASYAAYAHLKMAEKEFNEGSIMIGELSRVTEIYTKAQVDYEIAVNDLKANYMQLELIVGRPLIITQ
ncbi:MAG: TolC family protein [Chitinophagales bacterium]|nr:TolC family protein [Chitinophagales bacterium]